RKDYPANEVIYRQDESDIHEVSFIAEGLMEKYFLGKEGKKLYPENFGPGDTFGAISVLLNNQTAIRSVRTLKASTIYQLSDIRFRELCEQYPAFYEFFTNQFGKRMLRSGYAHWLNQQARQTSAFQVADLAFTQQVGSYFNPNVNTCTTETSIREAARSMTYYRENFVLVLDRNREPVGLVTDQELRNKVVVMGLSVDRPVKEIMVSPLREIQSTAYSYEAILLMFRHKVDYLLVRKGEGFAGVISLDRLLNAQGKSPFIFVQSISLDHDAEALKRKWAEVPRIISQLIDRGTRPEIVNQVVSAVSDAIGNNIIRRAIERLGPPPARFVFMALGSEGRKEQTLSTDQDNAIIYEDLEGEARERARAYFLRLGEEVCDELNEVGFDYCDGNLMAKNPKWNHSLSHWKTNYQRWVAEPGSDNALIGGTFFDCRSIYGDAQLLTELRQSIFDELDRGGSSFFANLARAALVNRPPLSLFGGIQTTADKDRKGINVKQVMNMFSDYARLHALNHQLTDTNTGERLRHLAVKGILNEVEFEELHQGYYFLMRLRMMHQAAQMEAGNSPDNLLDIRSLTKIERVTIKEILKVIETYQKRLGILFLGSLNA
ncbi:MAG: DUF294 nucleotidyltransferase-like domain-containing protein, partial [Bacteroidota bacterium]